MRILAIEIQSTNAVMLIIDGNKNNFIIENLGKALSIPAKDPTIKSILDFQINFEMFLQNKKIDKVVLCEGGKDSKKLRIRMEYAILSECEKCEVTYISFSSGACTKLINKFLGQTNKNFEDELARFNLPKYMGKSFIAGWRYLD